jgi:hypothetical protein
MNFSLKHMTIVAALAMFVLIALSPFVREKSRSFSDASPRQRSIERSGLPPRGDSLVRASLLVAVTCVAIVFFWSYKLDKSLATEGDVIRLRRRWKIFNFLLLVATLLAITQIAFAIFGLLKVHRISLASILHSSVIDGLMHLFIYISFFVFSREHIKIIQTISPSDILAFKRRDSQP